MQSEQQLSNWIHPVLCTASNRFTLKFKVQLILKVSPGIIRLFIYTNHLGNDYEFD